MESTPFDKEQLHEQLAGLVSKGIFVGTSSWKSPGWVGTVYDETRYLYRGKFAKSRLGQACLAKYALRSAQLACCRAE